ncbi:FAD:protein FMN transferase [Candidatus Woesearchaeota archaeon]|nr:FAD:protein FMN transferase [Candidatus Woesearchaeota archaeon]
METRIKIALLGDFIEIILYDIPEEAASIFHEDIVAEALRLQKIFNLFDPESELNLLNRRRNMSISDELKEVLVTALYYCNKTDGRYDITKGKNYLQRKHNEKETELDCSYRDIIIEEDRVILSNPDILIDLGSIAKGYIGDKLTLFLRSLGIEKGFIDLRGDLISFGHLEVVKIKDPRKDNYRLSFVLEDSAVATSGDYMQFNESHDKSHIIRDERKDTKNISVSILADTLMRADALATCIMIDNGFLNLLEDEGYVIINNENNIIKNEAVEVIR